jgi:hypothetical protein
VSQDYLTRRQPYPTGHLYRSPYPFPCTRGERSPAAKLTDAQVAEIRRRYAAGERAVDLAGEYGVHKGYVQQLARKARRAQT